jgi:hypothetical protein
MIDAWSNGESVQEIIKNAKISAANVALDFY